MFRGGAMAASKRLSLVEFISERRHRFEEVRFEAKVGNLEDWRIFVLIDCDNHFAIFHAG